MTAVVAGLCAISVTAHEQAPLPSGADLVARYVAAIGGADAWRALTSVRATGTTELPAQNLRGTFETISARPMHAVVRMELAGIGKVESGFNGEVGWTLDPLVGPSLVTGGPLAEMKNDAHFDAALHPPDLVASITTAARVEFDGRPAFKARVIYTGGQERDEFFDVDSGLLLGSEAISDTPMGKVPVRIVLRDYKAFGAVTQPTRMIQSSMGFDQHFVVESIDLNTVKPGTLEPPAVIRAMIKTESWRTEALASFDVAWTTIHDSHYDPTFGGLDWEGVRTTLRPKIEAAPDAEAARNVIREMLATLKQSHFGLMSSEPSEDNPAPSGLHVVPIDVRLIGDEVVISSVREESDAARAGLRPGQVLLEVDGELPDAWVRLQDGRDPRLTAFDTRRRVQRALHGAHEARLRVRDADRERVVLVKRVPPEGERVTFGDLPPFHVHVTDRAERTTAGHAVGVIAFNGWMAFAGPAIEVAIDRHRASRGLVIDLRGNPGGLANMIGGVAGHLLAEPLLLGRMKTRDADLRFTSNPRIVMPDGRRVVPFSGPVALLVDELTASASECFAGGLQSLGRARVFGRTTAGQALPASTKRLPNGDVLMYVVGDFVTSTGQRLEGRGVVPEEPVVLDAAALLAGKDPDMDAALRWLDAVLKA
jgi:carboxyl-terminal processing protease